MDFIWHDVALTCIRGGQSELFYQTMLSGSDFHIRTMPVNNAVLPEGPQNLFIGRVIMLFHEVI